MDIARRQLAVPVVAALLGIALVLGTIAFGRNRVSDFMDTALYRAESESAEWLGMRAYAVFLEQAPGIDAASQRADPSNPRLWQACFHTIVLEFARYPGYRGVALTVGWAELADAELADAEPKDGIKSALLDHIKGADKVRRRADGVVFSTVSVPNCPQVRMALARTNALHLEERAGLMNFVAFVPVAVAVAAWVIVLSFWYFGRGVRRVLFEREQARLRMANLSDAARGIAHEVRNPLNAVSLTLQYMQRLAERRGALPSEAEFTRIHAELQRVNTVVDGFVRLARADEFQSQRFDLSVMLQDVDAELRAAERIIPCNMTPVRELWVDGDRVRLAEVVRTLLRHMSHSGASALKVSANAAGGSVLVRIEPVHTPEITTADATASRSTRPNSPLLVHTLSRLVLEAHGGSFSVEVAADGAESLQLRLPQAQRE